MSSVVDLIVLASSAKNSERCIAGIDQQTGRWIRPVGPHGQGEVPFSFKNINGQEPEILDIVSMELEQSAKTHGFQMENRTIVAKTWHFKGKASVEDVLPDCCREEHVFYDSSTEIKYVDLKDDPSRCCSLQLWEVQDFRVAPDWNMHGNKRWKGTFSIDSGARLSLIIKDIDLEQRLNSGYRCSRHCLILIGLGVPFLSQFRSEQYCWKLIATVIEL